MRVCVVNGQGASGKDTFEKMVTENAEAREKKVCKLSTIDYVKTLAQLIGWEGSKEPKDRKFLSDLKDALTEWNDSPFRVTCSKINALEGYDLVFIDCREPKEIKRFVETYGALTVIVKRYKDAVYGNHADDDVENYDYDVVIDNTRGLAELNDEASIFVETFMMGE